MEHYQRLIRDSRLVYIPQEAGNITAVPATEPMCFLAHAQCRSDWSSLKIVYACVTRVLLLLSWAGSEAEMIKSVLGVVVIRAGFPSSPFAALAQI